MWRGLWRLIPLMHNLRHLSRRIRRVHPVLLHMLHCCDLHDVTSTVTVMRLRKQLEGHLGRVVLWGHSFSLGSCEPSYASLFACVFTKSPSQAPAPIRVPQAQLVLGLEPARHVAVLQLHEITTTIIQEPTGPTCHRLYASSPASRKV